jgi:dipeptidase
VGNARGSVYEHTNLDKRFFNWSETQPIGSIPEATETYGYIDGVYGILNEHQLAFGESTCGARFFSKPKTQGGDALFDIAALSRVAMQRTKTARESIQLMGDLAVKYGYYGAAWEGDGVLGEAGEALTIADPTEAWMFHILPDDSGKSAVWVAQRVPDDHVAVVANAFVIHEINLTDTDNFMASANIYDVAIRNNLWSPESATPFDFAEIYSDPLGPGETRLYSNRRVWRVLTLADPSSKLSPDAAAYPLTVEAASVLSPHDIMRFHRDHYEGTPFDMTQGPAGGAYGNPDRYDPGANGDLTPEDLAKGRFERAISIFRASYTFISVLDPANADNAFLWFGQYGAHATIYAPVYAKVNAVPTQYSNSSLFAFDKTSSFWVNALVGNWAARFYKFIHPEVEKTQLAFEKRIDGMQSGVHTEAARLKKEQGDDAMRVFLTERTSAFAQEGVETFWTLFEHLVTIYHDGYEMTNLDTASIRAKKLFYPKWWLERVGFFKSESSATATTTHSSFVWTAVAAAVAAIMGGIVGRKTATWGSERAAYKSIQ